LYQLEKSSEHPLAAAIAQHLQNLSPNATSPFPLIEAFQNVPGHGITATIQATNYQLGSWDWITQITPPDSNPNSHALAIQLLQQAQTTVALSANNHILAVIGITDPLKENALATIQDIQNQGIGVHLLTGDNPQTAQKIATALGIEAIVSQALPNTKLDYIKQLQSNNRTVAMVGDGINDAQALAQADVSFAMGTGSALAMESAGVTLTGGQISQISQAISLSKQTLKTIHMNLIWAFGYNVLAIPMAMGIFLPFGGPTLNPMIAGAAMSFSSISVVLNSLWLSKRK
jgi:P-type Cu2+ transporter